jgi:hypothetical protein
MKVKVAKTLKKASKEEENIHKTLKALRTIAEKKIPLQQKVDRMNKEMLRILKPTMN